MSDGRQFPPQRAQSNATNDGVTGQQAGQNKVSGTDRSVASGHNGMVGNLSDAQGETPTKCVCFR